MIYKSIISISYKMKQNNHFFYMDSGRGESGGEGKKKKDKELLVRQQSHLSNTKPQVTNK